MATWKNAFEQEINSKYLYHVESAIDIYNQYVEDAEEYGYASDAEFQGALAWFHNAVCEKFGISRERFSMLRVGAKGWEHTQSGARLCVFDSGEVYFIGQMIASSSSPDGIQHAPNLNVEWNFVIEANSGLEIPEKVFECEKIIFNGGTSHENFYYGGYVIPPWLAQIIVEMNS